MYVEMRHEFTLEIIATIDPCYMFDELTYQLATRYKYYWYRSIHMQTHIHEDYAIIDSVVSVTAL